MELLSEFLETHARRIKGPSEVLVCDPDCLAQSSIRQRRLM